MLKDILSFKANKKVNYFCQDFGCSLSLLAASQLNNNLNLIIANSHQVNNIEHEIEFFTGVKPLTIPSWEILPYDNFSPHVDIINQRLYSLQKIRNHKGFAVIHIETALQFLTSPEFVANTIYIEKKQIIDRGKFIEQLVLNGYKKVDAVFNVGEFAVRGSLIDLAPFGEKEFFRIDFFDDYIDEIRTFCSETQRTISQVFSINLLPSKEFPLENNKIFQQNFIQEFGESSIESKIFKQITNGELPDGVEYYLPLFFEKQNTIFDFIPKETNIFYTSEVQKYAEDFLIAIKERFRVLKNISTNPILEPSKLFLNLDIFFQKSKNYKQFKYQENSQPLSRDLPNVFLGKKDFLKSNFFYFLKTSEVKILIVCESTIRLDLIENLLRKFHIQFQKIKSFEEFLQNSDRICLTTCILQNGLLLDTFAILTESMIYQTFVQKENVAKRKTDNYISNIDELNINELCVHKDYGIGRYKGLTFLSNEEDESEEFVLIEYADDAKIYVPITGLNLISKYVGSDSDNIALNNLSKSNWSKSKTKALKNIEETAIKLLDLQAQRNKRKGFALKINYNEYQNFVNDFPFEETADQALAINDVLSDMSSDKPMDRLICGDVGFGKTEVAMRAAFIAISNNKQVAILVPTTLLAEQHLHSFQNRFSNFAVKIHVLSRFQNAKEIKLTLEEVKIGKIDILIGTHKLLQKNIEFNDLGLIIIDEEHRFGVAQKEKLKQLRFNADVLSLTATPIPRSLNMALFKLREMSIIATAPNQRLSIKTFVEPYTKLKVSEAVLRELWRGGQIYYLHNNVATIEYKFDELKQLFPQASIAIGHGQMNKKELEKVMTSFYNKKFDILIATTIIETGIDIPNANTILIDDADNFGLAQLHQLRGRVGRSSHQSYAYLFIQPEKKINKDAQKRLDVLKNTSLGEGFALASHDLEIRGAGEILGEEQSGNINNIGFNLYLEFLTEAVNRLKNNQHNQIDCQINLQVVALIPKKYIDNAALRLNLYRQITDTNIELFDSLERDILDRFGPIPYELLNLLILTKIRKIASQLGIIKIDSSKYNIILEFMQNANIDSSKLIQLIQNTKNQFLLNSNTLIILNDSKDQMLIKLKNFIYLFV